MSEPNSLFLWRENGNVACWSSLDCLAIEWKLRNTARGNSIPDGWFITPLFPQPLQQTNPSLILLFRRPAFQTGKLAWSRDWRQQQLQPQEKDQNQERKGREKKRLLNSLQFHFSTKRVNPSQQRQLITKFERKIVETKKRQAKTEELSLSRFQKSSCLLKQPKNSKKILKKKAINPEIKNPSQVTISLRKVAIRKMESGNGLEKLKQGNRASRKTKFCVGGKQGKKRQLRSPSLRPFHARIVI